MEDLLRDLEYKVLQEASIQEFSSMEHDSRQVQENSIFVALEGEVVDGHNFIEAAIEKGAKLIFVSSTIKIFCLL